MTSYMMPMQNSSGIWRPGRVVNNRTRKHGRCLNCTRRVHIPLWGEGVIAGIRRLGGAKVEGKPRVLQGLGVRHVADGRVLPEGQTYHREPASWWVKVKSDVYGVKWIRMGGAR